MPHPKPHRHRPHSRRDTRPSVRLLAAQYHVALSALLDAVGRLEGSVPHSVELGVLMGELVRLRGEVDDARNRLFRAIGYSPALLARLVRRNAQKEGGS